MIHFYEAYLEPLMPVILALVGGSIGLWRFLIVRRDELAWKRTEFLFNQAYYLDTNKELSNILAIIEGRDPSVSLQDILDEGGTLDTKMRCNYLHELDKLLNLFDRLYYAVCIAHTLSVEEMVPFGWYIEKISGDQRLIKYCENYGFHNILELAQVIRKAEKR